MMKNKLVLAVLVLLLMGCGGGEETAVLPTDSPSSPTPVPELRYDGPRPEPGTGNVYGQIMWNSAAATGLDLLLCQDFSWFSGCDGEGVTAVTDETGYYLFQNVAPGTYALSIRIFDSDDWTYIDDGFLSAADFVVEADETLVIETHNIYKMDLRPLEPGPHAKLKSGRRPFNWEAYPDAAYYEIYLTPDKGESIFVIERVDANQIVADLPPINCDYRWSLEAFNRDGVKIAETRDYVEFQVAGEQADCTLTVNSPIDDSSIPAHGIVLDWEPHPLAVSYKILMWDDSDKTQTNILDFATVTESQFTFNGALKPDHRYVWSVHAYDANGRNIAASEIYDFTVIP